MLAYQLRPRVFFLEEKGPLRFPCPCELRFYMQPAQPFGVEPGGGSTSVRGVAGAEYWDSNTGKTTVESEKPLSPLDVTIKSPKTVAVLQGTTLTIKETFASLAEVGESITSVFFVLPMILNLPFADPPYVERVDGVIGSVPFRWVLQRGCHSARTTTQEMQEQRFADAWTRMSVVADPARRRLLAALHYFHVACRLNRASCTAGEFMAEVVLNLANTLEVLFPADGDGSTRDAARRGLRDLGLMDEKIESDFIPAMALRNEIDVAHVGLGVFDREHLSVIQTYTERVEMAFREMLDTLLTRIESGEFEVALHEPGPPSKAALETIARLQTCSDD